MEDILGEGIESGIEAAVYDLIVGLVSFIFANIGIVLLVVLAAVILIVLLVLNAKHKLAKRLLTSAQSLQQGASSQINNLLVSDTFKDLELGLAQGTTARRLRELEQTASALYRESEELSKRLNAYRPSYLSLMGPLYQAKEMEHEANDLALRAERYIQEISKVQQQIKEITAQARELKQQSSQAAEFIHSLAEKTGYSLTYLKGISQKIEEQAAKTEQLAAFDALQAMPEINKVRQVIDALYQQGAAVQKQSRAIQELRGRLQERKAHLTQRIESEKIQFTVKEDPLLLLQRAELIIQELEGELSQGHEVYLSEAEQEIEHIWKSAVIILERGRP